MNVNKNDALQGHIHLRLPRFHPNSSPHNVRYPHTSISSTPLEEEGYCLAGISAFWLQANQFSRPVASFLLGAGENDTGRCCIRLRLLSKPHLPWYSFGARCSLRACPRANKFNPKPRKHAKQHVHALSMRSLNPLTRACFPSATTSDRCATQPNVYRHPRPSGCNAILTLDKPKRRSHPDVSTPSSSADRRALFFARGGGVGCPYPHHLLQ